MSEPNIVQYTGCPWELRQPGTNIVPANSGFTPGQVVLADKNQLEAAKAAEEAQNGK